MLFTKENKRYFNWFIVSIILYAIVLFAILPLLDTFEESPLRYLFASAPIIPTLMALISYLRWIRGADEMMRRMYSEAFAISAIVTGFLTFSYGFLELVGFPKFGTLWFFPTMIMIWGIALAVLNRRLQ